MQVDQRCNRPPVEVEGDRLVTTAPTGVNACFLRNHLEPSIPACTPEAAFRLLQVRRNRFWMILGHKPEAATSTPPSLLIGILACCTIRETWPLSAPHYCLIFRLPTGIPAKMCY